MKIFRKLSLFYFLSLAAWSSLPNPAFCRNKTFAQDFDEAFPRSDSQTLLNSKTQRYALYIDDSGFVGSGLAMAYTRSPSVLSASIAREQTEDEARSHADIYLFNQTGRVPSAYDYDFGQGGILSDGPPTLENYRLSIRVRAKAEPGPMISKSQVDEAKALQLELSETGLAARAAQLKTNPAVVAKASTEYAHKMYGLFSLMVLFGIDGASRIGEIESGRNPGYTPFIGAGELLLAPFRSDKTQELSIQQNAAAPKGGALFAGAVSPGAQPADTQPIGVPR